MDANTRLLKHELEKTARLYRMAKSDRRTGNGRPPLLSERWCGDPIFCGEGHDGEPCPAAQDIGSEAQCKVYDQYVEKIIEQLGNGDRLVWDIYWIRCKYGIECEEPRFPYN